MGDQAKDGCCEFFFVSIKKNGESPEEAHPDDGEEENDENKKEEDEIHEKFEASLANKEVVVEEQSL